MRLPVPDLLTRREDGSDLPLLVWRFDRPVLAIASAPFGGGLGERAWLINATVSSEYRRMDPEVHLAELARGLALDGAGVGLLTAVDVRRVAHAEDGGVAVAATVGLGHPTWAAVPDTRATAPDGEHRDHGPTGDDRPTGGEHPDHRPTGTINIVACVPVRLADAALVNAVATATEAKAQALWQSGVAATGTATDAICVLCPTDGPAEPFAGPCSPWGARLARAVHAVVRQGGADWTTLASANSLVIGP